MPGFLTNFLLASVPLGRQRVGLPLPPEVPRKSAKCVFHHMVRATSGP